MSERDRLAQRFEADRGRLRAVAYRMLGSTTEADDAVQESWLRLDRSDTSDVENLGGWLTTIVARVCLDMLRSRTSRREDSLGVHIPDPPLGSTTTAAEEAGGPENEALLSDAVGSALLVVLDTLAPAERLAFVLHDLFAVPFDEIAEIVGRSPAAARQLASRARRRVHGERDAADAHPAHQRDVVNAFLAASREGRFDALLALLDPDVVLRADDRSVEVGALPEVRGAHAVAATFCGRARAARLAVVDGAAGMAWAPGGQPRVVFDLAIAGSTIVAIDMIADPDRLRHLDIVLLDHADRPRIG
jgi:RNA polymerase sigma factor (sigma-70 family)